MRSLLGISSPAESAQAMVRAPAAAVLAGPVDPERYRVGPGDVLSLEYGGKALDTRTLVVDSEGRVRVPNLGLVNVGGTLLSDVRTEIVTRLKPYLPGATLDLRLLQPRTFKVFILGEVNAPGSQQVVGSARVSEAIAAAGGFKSNASQRNIQVLRRDGRVNVADLVLFERAGDWDSDPYLEDGDRILVKVANERIGVFGAVLLPDFYEYHAGDSLRTAIRVAGGLSAEARTDSVLLLRFEGAQHLDTLWTRLDDPQDAGSSLLLQPDDRIFIRPKSSWRPMRQITVTGEVRAPGVYSIEEGKDRVSEVIGWAGGFGPEAARRNVRIERHEPGTGDEDVEFQRLSKLSRAEMTNSEYQTFRSKLAVRQSSYLIDFSSGSPQPPGTDVLLRDGDHIDVPRIEMAVRVDGQVRAPGLIAYKEGQSTYDYIRDAGGTTKRANIGDARITRAGSSATLFARDVSHVEPGDFIWIPEKKDTSFWTVARDLIIVAGQVATIVLVVHQLSSP
jgi:protein involved in polysaccharide export with SLBB domain